MTVGTVKVYWLIDLIRLINSIIFCQIGDGIDQ